MAGQNIPEDLIDFKTSDTWRDYYADNGMTRPSGRRRQTIVVQSEHAGEIRDLLRELVVLQKAHHKRLSIIEEDVSRLRKGRIAVLRESPAMSATGRGLNVP